ncbi:MAG: hypothetical protein QM783_15485 [Phycisphaerales bacterium]
MTTLDSLKDRYLEVKQRCAEAARQAGRDPSSVMLVAVSKYAGIDDVRELVNLGHRDFGENLVPSLVQRAAMIDEWQARQKTMARTKASASCSGQRRHALHARAVAHDRAPAAEQGEEGR